MAEHNMFINLIELSPGDRRCALDSIRYIIEEGSGGRHLDTIQKKSFRMSVDEYFNRLVNLIEEKPSLWSLVYDALEEWYGTFVEDYRSSSTIEKLRARDAERPIHTWVHCLVTGELHVLRKIRNDERILIEEKEWEELQKRTKGTHHPNDDAENLPEENQLSDNLLRLLELDEETRLKAWFFGKRIAVFIADEFEDKDLARYMDKYHLDRITQYSTLSASSFSTNHDLFIYMGKQAKHESFHKLKSKVPREKIVQVSGLNIDIVFDEVINQMKGRINHEQHR